MEATRMTTNIPTPSIMKRFAPSITVAITPETTVSTPDSVVKAKRIKPGMVVRAWLHDAPRGGERTVATVEVDRETGMVAMTFSSQHPDTTYKAAYHFLVVG